MSADRRKLLVTWTVSIDRDGNVYDDTQVHGNSFADVYRGFVAIRKEVNRQIAERRICPFNPRNKDRMPDWAVEPSAETASVRDVSGGTK